MRQQRGDQGPWKRRRPRLTGSGPQQQNRAVDSSCSTGCTTAVAAAAGCSTAAARLCSW